MKRAFLSIISAGMLALASSLPASAQAQNLPQFPGGADSLKAYIDHNLRYPKDAAAQGIQGDVELVIFIDKEGDIYHIQRKKVASLSLYNEARRVINKTTNWKPARTAQGGFSLTGYPLTIPFRLPDAAPMDPICTQPDVAAQFPGGPEKLAHFIEFSVSYPPQAGGVKGTINVHFTVEKDGLITEVEAPGAHSAILADEAIRVILDMDNWTPATKDGQPVRSKCEVPVTFK